MNRLRILPVLLASIGSIMLLFAPLAARAATYDPTNTACSVSSSASASNSACQAPSSDPVTGQNGIIVRVANVIAFVAGAVAVIMIIFAGFSLIKSGGDSGKITRARETIIYAIVGIVVIAAARLIVGYVITKL